MKTRGSTAVSERRHELPGSLDYFPTAPWATRAVFPLLLQLDPVLGLAARTCWEPSCGEGHMAAVLEELFPGQVRASDVYPYGYGEVLDFLTAEAGGRADWIIGNPPFNAAQRFVELALDRADVGVAMLLRLGWLAGGERYSTLFRDRPPAVVAPFSEKVSLVKGRWDPRASIAQNFAWFIFLQGPGPAEPVVRWIEPGRKTALTRPDDFTRFAAVREAPLLAGIDQRSPAVTPEPV